MVNSEDVQPVPVLSGTVAARPPLPRWTVPAVALLVLVVDVIVTVAMWRWVDVALADLDKRAAAHLDVLKLTASIAVGGGGLFALYLAARRQRTQEFELEERKRELAQRERVQAHAELVAETNRVHAEKVHEHAAQVAEANRVHAERVAADNRVDAAARRVTELFAKSVEQLGSDKAAVRLGGLYALERLAQDNPDQRSTVVQVFCAYLRMPFELPGELPQPAVGPEYEAAVLVHRERVQEREVRVAAQRILRDHLRPGTGPQPAATFWPDTDLNLTGAHLTNFDLNHCAVRTASFGSATFSGAANFRSATFTGVADFVSAMFSGSARFESATFTGVADLGSVTFTGFANFRSATFASSAYFGAATFSGVTDFRSATFAGTAYFASATFTGSAGFESATFTGSANFRSATFAGSADFRSATFDQGVPRVVQGFSR